MLELKKIKLKTADHQIRPNLIEKVSTKDIAIIGMACQFPNSQNVMEFWHNLEQGWDLIQPFPDNRRQDVDPYLLTKRPQGGFEYMEGGFLAEIDKFDPLFFKISPKEAQLIDPNQRLFLQTAWQALEDAGYGGESLRGSKTGVYLGYSSDFGSEYKILVQELDSQLQNLSLGGNIRSIIASRIAYLLDFKGPSLVVDTACSSSLTAIHLACQGLRQRECDQALAGSIKIKLFPVKTGESTLGIRSLSDRAKTFDRSSDGTGSGEGVAVILLKPLNRALTDGDHILAVIKGSALNQDGSSIGITAPNAIAQAEVIKQAWSDAQIDPETISYIEAHGTGTKLGDPIEIDGITRAFQNYTGKKQFCGIGAIKTNVGHLDHASGMAGIVKLILALQHEKIPSMLHFTQPNTEIDFLASPVYIIERPTPWVSENRPRRCGISAFGLSGTNCHLVLEEAPKKLAIADLYPAAQEIAASSPIAISGEKHLLTLSAANASRLKDLIRAYADFLRKNTSRLNQSDLRRICYTANTGRGHYSARLAIRFSTGEELGEKISQLVESTDFQSQTSEEIYYGDKETRIQSNPQQQLISDELSSGKKIAELYVAGAEIDWPALYQGEQIKKIQLPTYPFEKKRYWVELSETGKKTHPLLDQLYRETAEEKIYLTRFNADQQWELKDHLINGYHVLPGTAYLEMAQEVSKEDYSEGIEVQDVIFLTPLAVLPGETREVQTIWRKTASTNEFRVISRKTEDDNWLMHMEAKISGLPSLKRGQYDLDKLLSRCPKVIPMKYSDDSSQQKIVIGPHWKNVQAYYLGEDELLVEICLQDQFLTDLTNYTIYPSLLDSAVNAASQQIGEGLYLPFSYKSLKIFQQMPAKFYSYIRKLPAQDSGLETIAFDISLLDDRGQVFIEISDYKVKKVRTLEMSLSDHSLYHQLSWTPKESREDLGDLSKETILFINAPSDFFDRLSDKLQRMGNKLITVEFGTVYRELSTDKFIISGMEADYHKLLTRLKDRGVTQIIHGATRNDHRDLKKLLPSSEQLDQDLQRGLYSLFYLSRALMSAKWKTDFPLILITDTAYAVTGSEEMVNPHNAAFLGIGKVFSKEFPKLKVFALDLDEHTSLEQIIMELQTRSKPLQVAYRKGQRYVEEFGVVNVHSLPDREMELREEGVYLITGGLGALGLLVSKHLLSQKKINLALINRTPLPTRSEGERLSIEKAGRIGNKLTALLELEAFGAEINHYAVNLADYSGMKQLIEKLRTKYGRINGVIHCAGVAGDGFLWQKSLKKFEEVLEPKVLGTWHLDQLTRQDRPDFFLLFSSINAHYGRAGQGDYTAANSYLDSFAAYRRKEGLATMAINWAAWQEIGMAVDYGVADEPGIFKALSTERGLAAFSELMHKDVAQITVGELNYQQLTKLTGSYPFELSNLLQRRISRQQKLDYHLQQTRPKEKKQVKLLLKGNTEFNRLEQTVAQIWAEVLGLEELDIYESFYDLGGDSILATYILKEMEQEFPGLIDIADIFTHSSVHQMSEYLESKFEEEKSLENKVSVGSDFDVTVETMLDQLLDGQIRAGEAERLLIDKLEEDL